MNDLQEKVMSSLASADTEKIRAEQKEHQGKVLNLLGAMKDSQMTAGMIFRPFVLLACVDSVSLRTEGTCVNRG